MKTKQTQKNIPKGWMNLELDDVSNIIMGQSPSSENYNEINEGLPLIQGNADIKNRKSIKRFYTSAITKKIDKGDLIMTVRAPVGYIAKSSFDSCIGRGVCGIQPKKVFRNYLYYYLINNENKINKKAQGSTFTAINSSDVKKIKILFPQNIKEQQKIAEILGTVDKEIKKTDEIIEKTEKLKKGLMQKLFEKKKGWEKIKLEDVCEKILGGGTPSRTELKFWDGDIPWMTVKDMNDRKFIYETQEYINEEGLKNSATNLIPKNNIITSTRMGIGRFYINKVDLTINQDLKGLIINTAKYDIDFIFWFLKHKSQELVKSGVGTTVKGIKLEVLKSLDLYKPPLKDQQKIAEILSAVDEKISVNKKLKEKLTQLKKGLMQDLLSGDVRVNV